MDTPTLLLGLALGLLIGLAVGVFGLRRPGAAGDAGAATLDARHRLELAELRGAETERRSEAETRLAALQATASGLREQLDEERYRARETLERALAEQAERAERERAESSVLQALAPVRETLLTMQRTVAGLEEQRSRQHGELSEQLRTATESEERLRGTAEALASALRSNSTRGVWGETQLRSVVEAAGLIERVDFDVQTGIASDIGAGRPDMIVHLPGGKAIAVDAKVPFAAYLEASAIPVTATGEQGAERRRLLTLHVKAVRDHITALGAKGYWEGLAASPELVIAFIPSESLVSSAMEADPSIMEYAFGKRVALASPVTLWSVLKTVAFSWQQDVLTSDAKVLFDLSRELHSRLSTTAAHIDKLGRTIERSVRDYNAFVGSLERQVLPTARKLSRLDESKVIGEIAGIDELPRPLTAAELVGADPTRADALAPGEHPAGTELVGGDARPAPVASGRMTS